MLCIDPWSLFMIDWGMNDKLIISKKWAEKEKKKALQGIKDRGIEFQPFQH